MKKTFTIRSATSDRHAGFFLFLVAFSRPARRNSLNATGGVPRVDFLERATVHFLSKAHTAHSVAQDKVVSASFTVIPHAHSHPVSLMSLLNVKFTPFPSLLSSPSASSSRASTSLPGHTRSWCQSPDAPARWRESGRLVDSAPNQGNEPKFADFSNYTDPELNQIDIPDNNPNFRCSDHVTMISGSARGLPNSEALSSSRKAAASKVSFLFGHTSSQETGAGHVSCRSSHRETQADLDGESVATTLFISPSRGTKRSRV